MDNRIGKTLEDIGVGKDYEQNPNCTGKKITKNQELGLHHFKKLLHSKETTNSEETTQSGNFFFNQTFFKGLISRIIKISKKTTQI